MDEYCNYYRNYPDYTDYPFYAGYPGPISDYVGSPCGNFWWGTPLGWSDLDLYDYNNNFTLDDNEIEDLVKDNIHADPAIPFSEENKINVSVKDGVVTLSGEVKNPRTKPLVYSDAFWSSGVTDVVNNISIKPTQRSNQSQPQPQEQEQGQTQPQGQKQNR